MKNELLKGKVFRNIREVIDAVSAAIDFYNTKRPHMSIGMEVPAKAIAQTGTRDMKWKSYRQEAIKHNQEQELKIPENSLPLAHPSGKYLPVNLKQE